MPYDVDITGTNEPIEETDPLEVTIQVSNTGSSADSQTVTLEMLAGIVYPTPEWSLAHTANLGEHDWRGVAYDPNSGLTAWLDNTATGDPTLVLSDSGGYLSHRGFADSDNWPSSNGPSVAFAPDGAYLSACQWNPGRRIVYDPHADSVALDLSVGGNIYTTTWQGEIVAFAGNDRVRAYDRAAGFALYDEYLQTDTRSLAFHPDTPDQFLIGTGAGELYEVTDYSSATLLASFPSTVATVAYSATGRYAAVGLWSGNGIRVLDRFDDWATVYSHSPASVYTCQWIDDDTHLVYADGINGDTLYTVDTRNWTLADTVSGLGRTEEVTIYDTAEGDEFELARAPKDAHPQFFIRDPDGSVSVAGASWNYDPTPPGPDAPPVTSGLTYRFEATHYDSSAGEWPTADGSITLAASGSPSLTSSWQNSEPGVRVQGSEYLTAPDSGLSYPFTVVAVGEAYSDGYDWFANHHGQDAGWDTNVGFHISDASYRAISDGTGLAENPGGEGLSSWGGVPRFMAARFDGSNSYVYIDGANESGTIGTRTFEGPRVGHDSSSADFDVGTLLWYDQGLSASEIRDLHLHYKDRYALPEDYF